MRRLAVAVLATIAITSASCTVHATASARQPGANDMIACADIDDQIVGAYAHLSQAQQQTAAQNVIGWSEKAENPDLRKAGRQLQADANAANQTGVNADLVKLAVTCHTMGIGPGDNG